MDLEVVEETHNTGIFMYVYPPSGVHAYILHTSTGLGGILRCILRPVYYSSFSFELSGVER